MRSASAQHSRHTVAVLMARYPAHLKTQSGHGIADTLAARRVDAVAGAFAAWRIERRTPVDQRCMVIGLITLG
jgi:hypothetical protein